MRWLRMALLCATGLLGACSTGTRLAYNNLDTLASVEVSEYVDLQKPQRAALKREFKTVWDWHRSRELPLYAAALRDLADTLDRGNPDRVEVIKLVQQVEDGLFRIEQTARPGLARLLASLDDKQVASLLAQQQKDLDERLQEWADETPEERRVRLSEKSEGRIDDWLGRVLPTQQALTNRRIAAAEQRGAFDVVKQRAEAEQQQALFATVLTTRAQAGFEARLQALNQTEDAVAERDANRERLRSYFVDLAGTLDVRQRSHLARRLRDFAQDCDVLAAKPLDPPQ